MNTLELWNKVEKTPVEHTKPITGKSYSGNSPKPHYLVRRATETFGPCGIGWGFTVVDERIEPGPGEERMHIARVRVWYKWNGERGEVEHIGGTPFAGVRKSGAAFMDEDAPKKSVTDALVKALSMIGFAGDIFLGRYDDSKYMAELREDELAAKASPKPRLAPPAEFAPQEDDIPSPGVVAEALVKALKMSRDEHELGAWFETNKPTIDLLPESYKIDVRKAYGAKMRSFREAA
jgi:hypothetical protein